MIGAATVRQRLGMPLPNSRCSAAAEGFAQGQPRSQESNRRPDRAARQTERAIDSLRAAQSIAALLLDDGLPYQGPMIVRFQTMPAGQESHGLVHVAVTIVQTCQPIMALDTRRIQP